MCGETNKDWNIVLREIRVVRVVRAPQSFPAQVQESDPRRELLTTDAR